MYFKPESAINVELLSNRVTVKMPFLRLKTWWRQTLGFPVICSFLWISVMILKFKVDQCWLCLQFVCFIYFDVLQFVYVSFCWMRYRCTVKWVRLFKYVIFFLWNLVMDLSIHFSWTINVFVIVVYLRLVFWSVITSNVCINKCNVFKDKSHYIYSHVTVARVYVLPISTN